jgi:hypothetical protein
MLVDRVFKGQLRSYSCMEIAMASSMPWIAPTAIYQRLSFYQTNLEQGFDEKGRPIQSITRAPAKRAA